jgi:Spy/CpxP family protein refolding chaperone
MAIRTLPVSLSFILAASLAAAPLASAQAPQPAPDVQPLADVQQNQSVPQPRTPDPHRQAMRIARELNLTAQQASQIEPIFAERDQKIATLRGDSSIDPKTARKQMHAIQMNARSQLSSVLTPDQMKQLQAMQHAHERHGQGQEQPAAAPSV